MRRVLSVVTIMAFTLMIACKGKPNDAELQTKVSEMVKVPGVMSEVKEGVVTLSGSVMDEAAKAEAETNAKAVEGIKSVTNNITITAPPVAAAPAITTAPDDALTTGVADATKDFPEVKATVTDGVITVTGEITAAKWKTLKMALDGLGPKKVDASSLTVK